MDTKELRECLGKDQKSLLSSVRSYVLQCLDYHSRRTVVLNNPDLTKAQKAAHFREIDDEIGFVTVHMFISEMYKRLLFGDKVIKDTVHTLESIDVGCVQIGSTEYSRESEYYERGAQIAQSLLDSIEDTTLRTIVSDHSTFHESLQKIGDYYGNISV